MEVVRRTVAEHARQGVEPSQIQKYDAHRAEIVRMKAAAILARYFVYQGTNPGDIDGHRNPIFLDPLTRMYAKASGISAVLEEVGLKEQDDHENSTLASTVIALVQEIKKMSHPDIIKALNSDLGRMEQLALEIQMRSVYSLVRANAYAALLGNGKNARQSETPPTN